MLEESDKKPPNNSTLEKEPTLASLFARNLHNWKLMI